ncbi:MAG: AAC(3)-I family aminoglycoside N-acetyltransferase [Bryobacteraceae bacterium]
MEYSCKPLSNSDIALLKELLKVFGEAFQDIDTYQGAVPGDAYLSSLLSKQHFIAIAAMHRNEVVGGLAAYVLEKFEQDRREIYIYDLAVTEPHRRKGIATQLIAELKRLAKERNAYIIFVQADHGDEPAIRLYESLGTKENVYHFDI